jgi:CheY-like chemotaxis protein
MSRLSSHNTIPGTVLSLSPFPEPAPTGPRVPKILVADDNIVILKALSMKLKAKGYEVRTAMDGSTAVSCVRREKPDIIVLDINFPPDVAHGGGIPWDGFLILDWLRRIDEVRDTPIIFITGGDSAKFRERAMNAGAVGFFQKPINHEEMLNLIHEIVGDPNDLPPSDSSHDAAAGI